METVLSGIRSTGRLHLGNYFGALRNFVKMQHTDRCFFFIADYHSLTTHPDPKALHGNVKNVLAEYLAAGLDPEVATIYIQSDVPQVAELSLLLSMHAYIGELERTASFKDKIRKQPENVNAGLLCYPVLMAADHPAAPRHARTGGQGPGAAPRTDAPLRAPLQPDLRHRVLPREPALQLRRGVGQDSGPRRHRQDGQVRG